MYYRELSPLNHSKILLSLCIICCVLLLACNEQKEKMESDLTSEIEFFTNNKESFLLLKSEIWNHQKNQPLQAMSFLDTKEYSETFQSNFTGLGIQKIQYGRNETCDARVYETSELLFYLDNYRAIWYCPCIAQSDKGQYHDNSNLRGYSGVLSFHSLGLGGNWAIIKIKK
jgi:hypothetical protein